MSGHSKWNNIKRKKEKTDGQRAKIFTKIGREMSVCVKAGGGDPNVNTKLRDLIAKERPKLAAGLRALGLYVVGGRANYLLFRAAGAADLNDRILTRGVLIRSCANYHGLGNDWYRVCVGQAEQNRRLLAALKEVL